MEYKLINIGLEKEYIAISEDVENVSCDDVKCVWLNCGICGIDCDDCVLGEKDSLPMSSLNVEINKLTEKQKEKILGYEIDSRLNKINMYKDLKNKIEEV